MEQLAVESGESGNRDVRPGLTGPGTHRWKSDPAARSSPWQELLRAQPVVLMEVTLVLNERPASPFSVVPTKRASHPELLKQFR
jgi:hypothetical protein